MFFFLLCSSCSRSPGGSIHGIWIPCLGCRSRGLHWRSKVMLKSFFSRFEMKVFFLSYEYRFPPLVVCSWIVNVIDKRVKAGGETVGENVDNHVVPKVVASLPYQGFEGGDVLIYVLSHLQPRFELVVGCLLLQCICKFPLEGHSYFVPQPVTIWEYSILEYLLLKPSGHVGDPFVNELSLNISEKQHSSLVRVKHDPCHCVDSSV